MASKSSSSSSSSSDTSRRSCSTCKKRMSNLKYDKHTICSACRDIRCDIENRCSECKDWTVSQMEDFIRHRKSLESKGPKKVDTNTSAGSDTNVDSMKLFEEKITSKVGEMVSSMIGKFSQDVITNVSLAAPSVIPECCPSLGSAGGDSGRAIPRGPSSAGLQSNKDPPHVSVSVSDNPLFISLTNTNMSASPSLSDRDVKGSLYLTWRPRITYFQSSIRTRPFARAQ